MELHLNLGHNVAAVDSVEPPPKPPETRNPGTQIPKVPEPDET